jgi:alpha-L-fucosidase
MPPKQRQPWWKSAVGHRADGRIPVIMQQRLLDMGKWLKVNGQAVFGTRKWRQTKEGDHVRYTAKGNNLYAICLNWPGDMLELAAPKPSASTTATLIGHNQPLQWTHADGKLRIIIPPLTIGQVPSHHAHVIKLTEVK